MNYLNLFSLPFNDVGAIAFIHNPILEINTCFFNKENKTVYHNMPYKLILLVHKDDFNKGIEECFRFAKELLFERIDKINQETTFKNKS